MKAARAEGKVKLAIARLASLLPYHSAVLARFVLVEDESVGTMGVGFRHGRLVLLFSPRFLEGLTIDQTCAVVAHEVGHVICEHILHQAQPDENRAARIISEETIVNQLIPDRLPLPCHPITLAQFPDLPPGDSTAERYERLRHIIPDPKMVTLDDHGHWVEVQEGGALAQAAIVIALGSAWDGLTEAQRKALPQRIAEKARKASANAQTSVIGTGKAFVNWREALRRYVGKTLERRSSYSRPPRRMPHLVGIVAGKARIGSRPKIVAVLDTSASLSDALLSDFSAELGRIARTHEVTVIEADNVVRAVYRYKPITSVSGRKGTDFRPAIELATTLKPDLLIYATDGHGKAPAAAPRFQVIWLLTKGGRKPVSWGKELRLCA